MRADVYKSTQIKADNLAPGQVGSNFVTLGSGVLSRMRKGDSAFPDSRQLRCVQPL